MLQLPVGDRRESPSRQLSGLQIREGGDAEKEVTEHIQREGYYYQTSPPQMCPSRRRSEAAQSNSIGLRHAKWQWQVKPQ
jgi:hypothetical protein